jgi:hypothetical protein
VESAWVDNGQQWFHPAAAKAALRHDLTALARDAVSAEVIAADARIFLLVDELAEWDGAALLMAALVGKLEDYSIDRHPVSAIVTVGPVARLGGNEAAANAVKIIENGGSPFKSYPIGPFSDTDAEVAIGHWLLGYEPTPLWWSQRGDEEWRKLALGQLLKKLDGTPGRYREVAYVFDIFLGMAILEPTLDRMPSPPRIGGV